MDSKRDGKMGFRKRYGQFNAQIRPEEKLVRTVVKKAEKHERKYKSKGVFFRRTAIALATVCVCLYVAMPVLASSAESVYRMMYLVSPAVAQYFMPVQKLDVDNGIKMEVVSAFIHGNTAEIYITMQDLEGDRIDDTTDLFDSYSINSPFDCLGHCERAGYEESTKTATFLITIEQWGDKDIIGDKITFSVGTFLSSKQKYENISIPVDLSSVSDAGQTQMVSSLGGGAAEEKWFDQILNDMPALVPEAPRKEFPVDGMELTGIAYVDGMLHIQTSVKNALENDNHGFFYLVNHHGEKTECVYSFSFMEKTELGERVDYREEVFEIPQKELAGYALYGDFVTTGRKTDGNWRVTFPLEGQE